MLLGDPSRTQADINFRLFGFPIRIHPFFWIITILLGLSAEDPVLVVLWVIAVLISIIVHELGHAFTQRYYGGHPWITLYAMGGLAACDDCDRSPRSQIIISLAGPIAGFLLAAALVVGVAITGHQFAPTTQAVVDQWADEYGQFPIYIDVLVRQWFIEPFPSHPLNVIIGDMLYINIWWGILNLMPIYPLDGGRVARELFAMRGDVRTGIIRSLQLSIVTAVIVGIYAFLRSQHPFSLLMFGYLAYLNYQTIQAYQRFDTNERW